MKGYRIADFINPETGIVFDPDEASATDIEMLPRPTECRARNRNDYRSEGRIAEVVAPDTGYVQYYKQNSKYVVVYKRAGAAHNSINYRQFLTDGVGAELEDTRSPLHALHYSEHSQYPNASVSRASIAARTETSCDDCLSLQGQQIQAEMQALQVARQDLLKTYFYRNLFSNVRAIKEEIQSQYAQQYNATHSVRKRSKTHMATENYRKYQGLCDEFSYYVEKAVFYTHFFETRVLGMFSE